MGNCDSHVLCKIISHDVLGETQSSSEMELIPIIPTRDHVIQVWSVLLL